MGPSARLRTATDFGVSIGQEGIGTKGVTIDTLTGNTTAKIADDVRSMSFTLSDTDPNMVLSLSDFAGQDFGVRLTSVGLAGGSREGIP